ncbi:MAG TPA: hypothetical protein PKV98_18230 [Burkholderiaceae bacterium]|nr:hypothetical protein [Burkholderiaceae bacterium]
MKITTKRTSQRIYARLQVHPHLRLAVMLTRGCVRTYDLSCESIDGLGRHFRLVGVYDQHASAEQIGADIEFVMDQTALEAA